MELAYSHQEFNGITRPDQISFGRGFAGFLKPHKIVCLWVTRGCDGSRPTFARGEEVAVLALLEYFSIELETVRLLVALWGDQSDRVWSTCLLGQMPCAAARQSSRPEEACLIHA